MILVAATLALVPAGYIVWGAFTDDDGLTLAHLTDAYGADLLGEMAWNSVWFAARDDAARGSAGRRAGVPRRPHRHPVPAHDLRPRGPAPARPERRSARSAGSSWRARGRVWSTRFWAPGTVDIFSPLGMVLVEATHSLPLVFLLMAGAFATRGRDARGGRGGERRAAAVGAPSCDPAAGCARCRRVRARRLGADARGVRGARPARAAGRDLGADLAHLEGARAPAGRLRRGGGVRARPHRRHRARRVAVLAARSARRGAHRRRAATAARARALAATARRVRAREPSSS